MNIWQKRLVFLVCLLVLLVLVAVIQDKVYDVLSDEGIPTIEKTTVPTEIIRPTLKIHNWRGWIAFISDHEGQQDIYLISPETGEILSVGLFDVDFMELTPTKLAWSPDWKMLSFVGKLVTDHPGLIIITVNYQIQRGAVLSWFGKIFDPGAGNIHGMAWSPDGKSIAISVEVPMGDTTIAGLGLLDMETLEYQQIDAYGYDPSWNLAGNQVVYTTTAEAGCSEGELAVYSFIDGSSTRILPGEFDLPNAVQADWSPGGKEIVFVSVFGDVSAGEYRPKLYVLDTESNKLEALDITGQYPSWSPDGKQIAFLWNKEIFVVNRDGTGLRSIFKNTGKVELMSPVWSP